MRITNLDTGSGWRIAAVEGELVVDLNRAWQFMATGGEPASSGVRTAADCALPSSLSAWLTLGDVGLTRARDALLAALDLVARRGVDWAVAHHLACPMPLAVLAPVVGSNASIFAVGLNYRGHALEAGMEISKYPMVFSKTAASLRGSGVPVKLPEASTRIDYEGEIVILIGRRCGRVSSEDAPSYIAGYCLANDLSARDWQFRTSEMMIGKAFDGFCPIGPWLLTADEAGDPADLQFRTFVNGEERQHGSASDLIFGMGELVSYLSQVVTLECGDAILTGTPGGIGAARKPRLWLQAGDEVRVVSPSLGSLENRLF